MKRLGRREFFGWGRHYPQPAFLSAMEEGKRSGVIGFVPGETSQGRRNGWVILAEKRLDANYHPVVVGSESLVVLRDGNASPRHYGMGCFTKGKVFSLQLLDENTGRPCFALLSTGYKVDELGNNTQVLSQWAPGCCPSTLLAYVGDAEGILLDRVMSA